MYLQYVSHKLGQIVFVLPHSKHILKISKIAPNQRQIPFFGNSA